MSHIRLLYLLADNKTKRHFRDRHEVLDDDSEASPPPFLAGIDFFFKKRGKCKAIHAQAKHSDKNTLMSLLIIFL